MFSSGEMFVNNYEMEIFNSDGGSHTEYTNCIVLQISPHQQPLTSTPMLSSSGVGMSPPGKSLADMEKALNESQMALRELQAEYNTYRKEKMENEK